MPGFQQGSINDVRIKNSGVDIQGVAVQLNGIGQRAGEQCPVNDVFRSVVLEMVGT